MLSTPNNQLINKMHRIFDTFLLFNTVSCFRLHCGEQIVQERRDGDGKCRPLRGVRMQTSQHPVYDGPLSREDGLQDYSASQPVLPSVSMR